MVDTCLRPMSRREPSTATSPDAALEAVARAWLDPPEDTSPAARAGAIVEAASARGDDRPAWLSQAFETLTMVVAWHEAIPMGERIRLVQQRIEALAACPHPRARWLGEAASGLLMRHDEAAPGPLVARLQQQPTAGASAAPPIERVWTEAALCSLLAAGGDTEAALTHGLRADRLARDAGLPALDWVTAHLLAYLFLRVGDCEAALPMATRAVDAAVRRGRRMPALHYNLMLAQLLSGAPRQAADHLDAHPWIVENLSLPAARELRPLAAAAWSAVGRQADALPLLEADDAEPPLDPADTDEVLANRAWLLAGVELQTGRALAARRRIETMLATPAGREPSPVNGTQLYLSHSRACEALGDAQAALESLKRSQAFCVNWVAESMQARMQVLLGSATHPEDDRHRTRLMHLNIAVQRARAEAAERALDRRNRFFAKVVHEIRNPVNGLVNMTSLLTLATVDERQRLYLDLAKGSAEVLLSLCNDVLDLASIDAGQFVLRPAPTDVGALVSGQVEILAVQAGLKGVSLQVTHDPALPAMLRVDALRLRQVLMNLLGNALKYTPRGSVTVATRWTPSDHGRGRLQLEVRDTGPGMTPQVQSRLFQEFQRGDRETTAAHEGVGLGLALCRQLVSQMQGRIDLDSAPGAGSRFTVELPLSID